MLTPPHWACPLGAATGHLRMRSSRTSMLGPIFVISMLVLATAHVNLITNIEDARGMSMDQLRSMFMQGTIEKGVPTGKARGFTKMAIQIQQPIADAIWDGKAIYLDPTAGPNCPNMDCGQRGCMYNVVGPGEHEIIKSSVYIGRLQQVNAEWASSQLDDKLSVILDYFEGMGDEVRLVNSDKDIYLGRFMIAGRLAGYFIITFPQAADTGAQSSSSSPPLRLRG